MLLPRERERHSDCVGRGMGKRDEVQGTMVLGREGLNGGSLESRVGNGGWGSFLEKSACCAFLRDRVLSLRTRTPKDC